MISPSFESGYQFLTFRKYAHQHPENKTTATGQKTKKARSTEGPNTHPPQAGQVVGAGFVAFHRSTAGCSLSRVAEGGRESDQKMLFVLRQFKTMCTKNTTRAHPLSWILLDISLEDIPLMEVLIILESPSVRFGA